MIFLILRLVVVNLRGSQAVSNAGRWSRRPTIGYRNLDAAAAATVIYLTVPMMSVGTF